MNDGTVNYNRVFIGGRLAEEPKIRYTTNGKAVANLRVTVQTTYEQDGKPHTITNTFTVVVWGRQAENCGEYLHIGSSVFVEGYFNLRESDEGPRTETLEIVGQRVQFLGTGTAQRAQGRERDVPFGR